MNSPLSIGILIDLNWPAQHHMAVFGGISRYAMAAGWNTVVLPLPEGTKLKYAKQHYDGIIGRLGHEVVEHVRKESIPMVNVWLNSTAKNIYGVYPDWQIAGESAAEHLLARGFRKFAYLGFRNDIGAERLMKRFRLELQDLEFDCDCHWVSRNCTTRLDRWDTFVKNLSKFILSLDTPVGVCISDDLLGRFFLDVCSNLGHVVPHEIAAVSMNNEPLICETLSPSLSSIDVDYPKIGWLAAELLDKLIQKIDVPDKTLLHPPKALVARQSTDVFAVEDSIVAAALRFIANQSQFAITVTDVAESIPTSRRTLERRFKDALGRTIADEIMRMKMERTKRQLLANDDPLKIIANRNGFKSLSHLCSVFRRECGVSPGNYRSTHKVNDKKYL